MKRILLKDYPLFPNRFFLQEVQRMKIFPEFLRRFELKGAHLLSDNASSMLTTLPASISTIPLLKDSGMSF